LPAAFPGEQAVAFALCGGLAAFLGCNRHSARVFMGDTGSLALGYALAAMAIQQGLLILLPLVGLVFVLETLSVIIQVAYFKASGGRRVFKMTPIHYTFHHEGWSERLADKLFVLSVLIVLVQEGLVAAWVVVVILSRELLITLLRTAAAVRGSVMAAAPLGKTKTVTQVVAVTLLILQRPYPWLGLPATLAVAFAVLFTVGSGLDYIWRWRHVLGPAGAPRVDASVGPAAGGAGGLPR